MSDNTPETMGSPLEQRLARIEETLEAMADQHARDLARLRADVRELEHDLAALAELAGRMLGDPFRSHAREIVGKRQTEQGG